MVLRLENFSRHPTKPALYRDEGITPDTVTLLSAVWKENASHYAAGLASLLIRPDTFVRKLGAHALRAVAECGFVPIAWRQVQLSHECVTVFWRFQLNKATDDRILLTKEISNAGPAMFLLLRDDSGQGTEPASLRLSHLKGPLSEARRAPYHIRSRLGMTGRTFGFIHTADEPLDIIREISILFFPAQQQELLAEVDRSFYGSQFESALAMLESWDQAAIAHSLSYPEAIARLAPQFPSLSLLSQRHASGGVVRLHELRELLNPAADEVKFWDYAVVAADLIISDKRDTAAIIDNLSLPDLTATWRRTPLLPYSTDVGRQQNGDQVAASL